MDLLTAASSGSAGSAGSVAGVTDLWIVALVAAPASFVTGFAAAAMSFTAWNLIVPLMFAAFGLPVFQALFISVMLDVCNGSVLTIIYGMNGKVDFRYGITFGAFAAVVGVAISLASSEWIANNDDKLATASSFVPLLIAIQFFVRGILAVRNKKRTDKLQQAQADALGISHEEFLARSNTDEGGDITQGYVAVQNEATLADARSFKEAEEHVAVPSPKKKSINVASNEKSPLLAHNINGEEHITFENEDSKEGEDEENVNKVSSFRFWLYLLTERFTPDENILKRPLKYIGARVAITVLVFTILGTVAGLLKAGGGMFYANIIVNAWGAKIRTAAGTGCFIMTMVMLMIALTFIGRDGMNSIDNLYHLLVSIPFGILGSIAGARLALRISDTVMFFVIAGVYAYSKQKK